MQETQETQVQSIPGLGRSTGGQHGNPLQYSCLGNRMDRGAWWAIVYGVAKGQMWLRMHALLWRSFLTILPKEVVSLFLCFLHCTCIHLQLYIYLLLFPCSLSFSIKWLKSPCSQGPQQYLSLYILYKSAGRQYTFKNESLSPLKGRGRNYKEKVKFWITNNSITYWGRSCTVG